jgi:lipopolysaccharide/colanic/teichoic acid biosynthesis glycosyltransferase
MYSRHLKRTFDIALVGLSSWVWVPIVAILYVLVRLDGGPGMFAHRRVGRKGETFMCLKLRSMVPDAPRKLEELLARDPAAAQEWALNQKLTDDPRITRIGKFIRQTSLDELPQLWNVLVGDMSLVGPRPVTEQELDKYAEAASVYKSMRPGITGAWQVSGRNDVSYAERVALDVGYARSLGFLTDLRIILKTFQVVLKRTGK